MRLWRCQKLPEIKFYASSIVPIERLSPKNFSVKVKLMSWVKYLVNKIKLVIINGQISPIQQQNLEKMES